MVGSQYNRVRRAFNSVEGRTREPILTSGGITMITKEQYAQKHQTEIDELSIEIEYLGIEINAAEADADGEHDNKDYIHVLRQRHDENKAKLAEIQAAGDNGWEDVKYGLKHTWITMKESFAKIISRFTS
jgi:hypothetical protein